ncbi:MAG: YlbF family regulator [Alicyclobacillaceae bacterium]|uniref:YlbF family regulator n=1 Tax=Alicyclobacillus sp. SP_1 TaxID=2942475 RepID=UPI002157624B|nr:YlbF family regulator [Alicyclobacillus sp. SP_1]MCY0887006.1 YlbF family regulator [Alicyclobacillaceae bacterium]MCY0897157.1 YlbF family regulator [Alicyclobacillaceae bacterium]
MTSKPLDINELLSKAEDLADAVLDSSAVRQYQQAADALQNNPHARALLRQTKDLADEVMDMQARGVPAIHTSGLLKKLEQLSEALAQYPEAQAMQDAQKNVDQLFTEIAERLSQPLVEKPADGNLEPLDRASR